MSRDEAAIEIERMIDRECGAFAPSDLWNAVMRGGERGNPDEFGFCCPLCFMRLAEERFGPMVFEVRQEVYEDSAGHGAPGDPVTASSADLGARSGATPTAPETPSRTAANGAHS